MKNKNFIILSVLLIAFQFPGWAQYGSNMSSNNSFEKDKESVYINFPLNMSGYFIDSGESLVLMPYIESGDETLYLPKVILNHNQNHSSIQGREEDDIPTCAIQNTHNQHDIIYEAKAPYAEWMERANLKIKKRLYGPNGSEKYTTVDIIERKITQRMPPPPGIPVHEFKQLNPNRELSPSFAGFAPMPEHLMNSTSLANNFSLYFPSKKSYQVTDMRENATVIQAIDSKIKEIQSNDNLELVAIYIIAGTSPDGTYYDNEQLTQKQALTFKSYLQNRYRYPDSYFQVRWDSEDWNGLVELIEKDYGMPYKYDVLQIINSTGIFTGRERDLMLLKQGDPYRYMKANMFPKLCKIDCLIEYKNK